VIILVFIIQFWFLYYLVFRFCFLDHHNLVLISLKRRPIILVLVLIFVTKIRLV